MNVTHFTQAIVAGYESRQPLMGWGGPGVGKSSGAREAARLLGEQYYPEKEVKRLKLKPEDATFGYIDLRLSIREPSDLTGVMWPDPAKGTVRYFQPGFLPTKGRGIINLDELPQATPFMQACASQLILDRRVGDYELPEGWYVVALGNMMSHRSATNAMPMHIKNRFVHLYVETDVNSWIQWALDHDVDVRVIAFIKFRRALLNQFNAQMKGDAYPTERSWEFVSKLVKTVKDRALLEVMVRGAVGDAAAVEFNGFLRVADKIPSIDGILMNPKTAPVPDDMATLYATTTALVDRSTKDNLANVTAYFNRVADTGKPDFAIAAIKEITARKDGNALTQTRAFIEFAAKHSHLMA